MNLTHRFKNSIKIKLSATVLTAALMTISMIAAAQGMAPSDARGLTMDFREADIRNVLRIIAQERGLNIIAGQEVRGTVTVHFRDVSLIEALDAILTVNGYTYEQVGNIVKVLPIEQFQVMSDMTDRQEKGKTRIFSLQHADARSTATTLLSIFDNRGRIIPDPRSNSIIVVGPTSLHDDVAELLESLDRSVSVEEKIMAEQAKTEIISRIYTFNHASAPDMKELISDMISADDDRNSRIMVDNRTNSMILVAPPSVVALVEQYIDDLDTKARQVMIEAKLVEVRLTDDETLGINWQWSENATELAREYRTNPNTGALLTDPVTGDFLYDSVRTDSTPTSPGQPNVASSHYNQNKFLHNVTHMQVDDALNIGLGGLMKFGRLSAVDFLATLNFLSARENTKLVSAPKVTTLNNQQARIIVREREPYLSSQESTQTAQTVTTTVEYKDIPIELTVTPQINENNIITMRVHANVEEKTGESKAIGGSGEPIISGREAETSVLVRDGDTIVIGGLVKNRLIESRTQVPVLGNLPMLGSLFRRRYVDDISTELLIFITPRIIDDSDLLREDEVNQFINERVGRNVFPTRYQYPSVAPPMPPGHDMLHPAPHQPAPASTPAPARSPEIQAMVERLRQNIDH